MLRSSVLHRPSPSGPAFFCASEADKEGAVLAPVSIGMAEIKSEPVPTSSRNKWPACSGSAPG